MPVQENHRASVNGANTKTNCGDHSTVRDQQKTDEQIVAVRVPTVQEQVIVQKNQSSR